jgi:hypothetical protein
VVASAGAAAYAADAQAPAPVAAHDVQAGRDRHEMTFML